VPSSFKAHVIIPSHSAHDTLRFAVLSAIDQTLVPQKITIVGDGPTEEVRLLAEELSEEFSIVEFQNKPKLGNRGEKYRDEVIKASDADFISYLCDDDLYMPNHLEVMSKDLEKFDFSHPNPTFVNPDGTLFFLPSGIEIPKIRNWHRLDPPQNTISLTGASHSRKSYLSLETGWDAGPPEIWTDLYMWVKFFSDSRVSAHTSPHTTTIKLMYAKDQRENLNRSDLIEHWFKLTRQPDQLAEFQNRVESRLKEMIFDSSAELIKRDAVTAERDAVTAERDAVTAERDAVTAERDAVAAERDKILASNSWKMTKPLRKAGSFLHEFRREKDNLWNS
jgi:glycosyltransferase involved in cell wall biosynthesis